MLVPEQDPDQAWNLDLFLASENSRRVFQASTLTEIFALLDDLETMANMTLSNWFDKPAKLGVVK